MRRCPECGAESLSDEEEATATRAILAAVVLTELDLARVHSAPDRLMALVDAKLSNLRESLLSAVREREA